MSNEDPSRRGFIKGAGLAATGLVLPEIAAAQAQGRAGAAPMSKGARFRAALATGQPLLLPVVESIMLARLCELEGFHGGFMGGSGMAARNALPNTSIQTVKEVIDYETHVMSNTDLPIVADGENGGGSPMTTYRTVEQLERGGAAVIMLEDPHGSVEVVVFPEAYAKCASVLEAGAMVVVKGKVELDEETIRMMANEVLPIEAMRQKMSRELSIKLTSPPHGRQTFEALADLFARHRGDRRVVLELELRDQQPPLRLRAPLAAAVRVRPSEQLATEVERICGAGTVVLR